MEEQPTTTTVVEPGTGLPLDMDATEIIGAAMVIKQAHTHSHPNHFPGVEYGSSVKVDSDEYLTD
jgi:hypothetical protein